MYWLDKLPPSILPKPAEVALHPAPSAALTMDEGTYQLKQKALPGLGFMCSRYGDYLLSGPVQLCFCNTLRLDTSQRALTELKVLVLDNLYSFLTEEERRLLAADVEFKQQNRSKDRTRTVEQIDINEMGDIQSGYIHVFLIVYYISFIFNND